MIQNIVIGKPLVQESSLLGCNWLDFEEAEKSITLYTQERFLPKILVEAGIVQSTSEVKRNKPELWIRLENPDYLEIKWGKKKLFIIVGE